MSQAICTAVPRVSGVMCFLLFIHFIWYAKEHTSHLTCCHAAARWYKPSYHILPFNFCLWPPNFGAAGFPCVQQSIIIVIQYVRFVIESQFFTRSHLPCSALCVFVHHTDKTRDLITALDVQISTFCTIFSRPIFFRFFFSFIFNRISSFGVSFLDLIVEF